MKLVKKFFANEDGATAIEYGLIAALVSVAAIVALREMGESLSGMFGNVSTELSTAVSGEEGATEEGATTP